MSRQVMKTADEYAELAEEISLGAKDEGDMARAQIYATLAQAAAVREHTRFLAGRGDWKRERNSY